MISTLGHTVEGIFRRTCPDPLVLAILLTGVTAGLAWAFTDAGPLEIIDIWASNDGLWSLLTFSMQMCLVLVTGHALAESRPVSALIRMLARIPSGPRSAVFVTGLAATIGGAINWGLGLIVGALLAREMGRAMHARGIRVHYPLLAAAGYLGLLVWHGGFSGSAPLKVTSEADLREVLPDDLVAEIGGGIPITETIGASMNLVVTGGLVVLAPFVIMLLCPTRAEHVRTIEAFDVRTDSGFEPIEDDGPAGTAEPLTIPERLERSRLVVAVVAVPLLLAVVRMIAGKDGGISAIGLNDVILVMLTLGLVAHGTARRYAAAVSEAAFGCAGIILQFPLYAGIMGIMSGTGLAEQFAAGLARIGDETTLPLFTFASAAIVNLFVPSGGGQWGVQAEVAMQAATDVGVSYPKMVMAVAYGDQLTNMLQPFWALPLLAITGVKARDLVGYTALVMLVAAAWIATGLLLW